MKNSHPKEPKYPRWGIQTAFLIVQKHKVLLGIVSVAMIRHKTLLECLAFFALQIA